MLTYLRSNRQRVSPSFFVLPALTETGKFLQYSGGTRRALAITAHVWLASGFILHKGEQKAETVQKPAQRKPG
ncbi:hypothetical protein DC20_21450 (plasmid) [Rufibacter tibetensis]|uniref:Uncharacterized protein n=1 Tax=Rufibacter tibetensis TaxID=512763 RepID=A0A0P0CHY5_9BACT|nr:hypothetical protein DC20_21450 [Rufibacter tibetensis]